MGNEVLRGHGLYVNRTGQEGSVGGFRPFNRGCQGQKFLRRPTSVQSDKHTPKDGFTEIDCDDRIEYYRHRKVTESSVETSQV